MTLPADVQTALADPKRRVGKYVLLRQLGKGGMGTVYLAWQIDLKRHVAVKFLLGNETAEDIARFYREAQTAALLSHPAITAIYEVGSHDGRHFIAMQYVEGRTLEKLLLEKASREQLVKIVRDVANAVHEAHTEGVVHRDLKPANVMVTPEGKAVVMDFGLARPLREGHTLTAAGYLVGTPSYMSPEQAEGGVTRAADIWSLGVILYQVATGALPFVGKTHADTLVKVLHDDVPLPTKKAASLPRALEAVIMKSLEKDASKRYATAKELAADLTRWMRGEPVSVKPPGLLESLRRKSRRHRVPLIVGAAGATIIATILAIVLLVGSSRSGELRAEARALMQKGDWAAAKAKWELADDDAEARDGFKLCVARINEGRVAEKKETDRTVRRDRAMLKLREAGPLLQQLEGQLGTPTPVEAFRRTVAEASAAIQAAVDEDPSQPETWFALGKLRFDLLDESCLEPLTKAIDLGLPGAQAHYLRARMNLVRCARVVDFNHIPQRRWNTILESARKDLEEALRKGLEPQKRLLLDAFVKSAEGHHDAAEKIARDVLKDDPLNLEALELRAIGLRGVNHDEAIQCCKRMRDRRPNTPSHWLRFPSILGRVRLSETLELTGEMIRIDPTNWFVWLEAGRIRAWSGQSDSAIAAFKKAFELNGAAYIALSSHADVIYDDLHRSAEAKPLYERIVSEGEDHVMEHEYFKAIGRIGQVERLLTESEATLTRLGTPTTERARQTYRGLHMLRAYSFATRKQADLALSEMDLVIAAGPQDCQPWFAAAEIRIHFKRDLDRVDAFIDKGEVQADFPDEKREAEALRAKLKSARGQ